MTMRYKQAVNLLAFFSLVIFVVIPGTLYLFNHNQWNYDYWLLIYFCGFGAISFIALYLVYYAINKFSNRYAEIFAYIIFSIGLITLLNDTLSPVQLGLLDGSRIHSNEPFFYTLIESIITFIAIGFVWFSVKKNKQWIYIIIKPIYFVSAGLIIFSLVLQDGFQEKEEAKNKLQVRELPNIYHFHIDGMQTDYFLRYINNHPEVKKKLEGFTLFEKNIANYHSTMLSLPSYMTSTTHLEGRFDKWLKSYDQGLLRKLKKRGYRLVHNSNAPYRSNYFDKIIASPELLKRYNGAQHLSIVEFTRIWLTKIIPNFLTNESLSLGKEIGKRFFYILNPNHDTDIALTMEDGTAALSGILLFKDMMSDIDYYSRPNQYVFSLNSILHDSYVSSPSCKIEKRPDFPVAQRYYRQLECAMMLIEEFVYTLKSLDRYNDSLIVIHGDHGSAYAGQLLDFQDSSFQTNMDNADMSPFDTVIGSKSLKVLESKARALLMVKPIFATGEMVISNLPTHLLDVYPTIMGQIGVNNLENIKGVDLFSNKDIQDRQRYFYYMGGSSHHAQITNYHTMIPDYDGNSGILSLVPKSTGKTTAKSFFKNAKDIKEYRDIKFYYTTVNGKLENNRAWIFVEGIDLPRNWGSWTNSDKVTLAFVPENPSPLEYRALTLRISDIFVNFKNPQLSAKFYLNKKLIGSLVFGMPKSQYSFPQDVEFELSKDLIIYDQPNVLEIYIEGANSERGLGIGVDDRKLGLALVELSLKKYK